MNIDRRALRDALARIAPGVGRGQHNGVLLWSVGHGLSLGAYDGDALMMTTSVDCGSVEPCGVVVEHARLLALVSASRVDAVQLEASAHSLRVSMGGGRAELRCDGTAELHPARVEVPQGHRFKVGASTFLQALAAAVHAAARGGDRPVLEAVRLEVIDGVGFVVATDGHRLVAARAWVADAANGIMLPVRAARALLGLPAPEYLGVIAGDTRVRIVCGDTVLDVRQVEGTYPRWRAVIPLPGARVEVDRVQMLETLRRLALLRSGRRLLATVEGCGAGLRLEVIEHDVGSARDVVPCDAAGWTKQMLDVGYLIDALSACRSPTVTLAQGAAGALAPLTVEDEPARVRELVMPARLAA